MVFFNYATMQMAAKVVYYGPGLCGKTTNLQYIYQKTSPKSRGEMVSLETETDRTLFFDLLPLDVGTIAGFKTRFQLYTVPGQVFYNSTRKLVLRGVDGIVFVVDSQAPMLDANIESMNNLKENLDELGINIEEIPLVLQYNKRDLKSISSVEELNRALNPRNIPFFEASALQGVGVFETLKGVSKATLITLRKKALGEEKPKVPEAARPATDQPRPPAHAPAGAPSSAQQAAASVAPVGPAPSVAPSPAGTMGTAAAVPEPGKPPTPVPAALAAANVPVMPTAAEIATETVEFSQITAAVTKPEVKKIAVKSSEDIASKLDALRDMYTGKPTANQARDMRERIKTEKMLSALLETAKGPKEKKISKKLKIRLDPHELDAIRNLALDFHLSGDNLHKRFSNALTVSVDSSHNPKRYILEIKLEILKK